MRICATTSGSIADSRMHPLLTSQLAALGLKSEAGPPPPEAWVLLLQQLGRSFETQSQGRQALQQALRQALKELELLQARVASDRELLDSRVRQQTDALRLSELLSLSADWIWEQDPQMRFTFISEGSVAAAGIPASAMLGKHRGNGRGFDAPVEAVASHEACVAARQPFRDFTYGVKRPDGVQRYIHVCGEPVFDEAGAFSGYRGIGRDVTQSAMAEHKVMEMASSDSLTGLANRGHFLIELGRLMARARRDGKAFAVCFIDLDRFKSINDSRGHEAGDELLKLMARRLRQALRESDLVARLGGDEFVVLIEDDIGAANLTRVAQKLLDAIAEPVNLADCSFQVTCSLGIAQFPRDGADAATLMRHADAAMYLAKSRGKNNLQFYTDELADESARQFVLDTELRQALERNELLLHYQPKIDLTHMRMVGVEALVRWKHPQRGLVPPGEFITLAEERGLIVALGRWVMQAACKQLRAWRQAGLSTVPVAINLSARRFASDALVDDIVGALREHGLAPSDIEVELTESTLMAEPERAGEVLRRLDDMGVRVSIDDFGTGYSSLSYLKRVPAQTVKIDRSFIQGLPDDKDDRAIVQAVIAMAHSLGLSVVAEGVETQAQLAMLRDQGCDEVQGYLLARPMPAADLALRLLPDAQGLAA